MDSLDLQVLRQARDWVREGRRAWLVTVAETWGSAPRPPGALLCLRDDGLVVGSVSGGCVEDDLIDRVRKGERVATPSTIVYGITKDEAARFGWCRSRSPTRRGSTRSSSAPAGTSWWRAAWTCRAAR
jgi:xanthine dehydrogenase accessory factor